MFQRTVARTLRANCEETIDTVCMGLPSAISAGDRLEGCRLFSAIDARPFLDTIFDGVGITPGGVVILNDAAMAGYAAIADPRLSGCRQVLLITLGFGAGAALVEIPR